MRLAALQDEKRRSSAQQQAELDGVRREVGTGSPGASRR